MKPVKKVRYRRGGMLECFVPFVVVDVLKKTLVHTFMLY